MIWRGNIIICLVHNWDNLSTHLVPQGVVGLDSLLLAVIVVHLGEAKHVQRKLQAIVIVEELETSGNGEDDLGVILDGQGVNDTRVLANPVSRGGGPIIPVIG